MSDKLRDAMTELLALELDKFGTGPNRTHQEIAEFVMDWMYGEQNVPQPELERPELLGVLTGDGFSDLGGGTQCGCDGPGCLDRVGVVEVGESRTFEVPGWAEKQAEEWPVIQVKRGGISWPTRIPDDVYDLGRPSPTEAPDPDQGSDSAPNPQSVPRPGTAA